MLTAGTAGTAPLIDPAGMTSLQQFKSVMAALNTGFAGRSLLAGMETGKAAVVEAETVLTAIETASLGATTAAELAIAVNDWFDDPAGYAATVYLGGAAL
ncbi:MAG: flagellar biosynthesis protein FlgL, partial [Cereibacter changlensis]